MDTLKETIDNIHIDDLAATEQEGENEETAQNDQNISRKAFKKAARALQILRKDTGIEGSKEVTRTIFVCNAGLVTGCASSDLLSIFGRFGPVQSVVMVPHKSYSFLVYCTMEAAKLAMAKVHGKVGLTDRGPLYLAFVERPPDFIDPWSDHSLPPGLRVVKDFVSEQEEKELLESFHWEEGDEVGVLKHRKVKHFGYEFSYKTHNIDPTQPLDEAPIPALCQSLSSRAVEMGLVDMQPDQLTVNRYLPGQGIPPHMDTHSCCSDTILSVCLGSGVTMDFRQTGSTTPVWLPPRCLLVMSGPARYIWSHGITPRHMDTVPSWVLGDDGEGLTLARRDVRVSLTFRKTITGPCSCDYPAHCDRQEEVEMVGAGVEERASRMESQLVHQVYEEIASHFSCTRHKPWPRVLDFLGGVEGVLLDLGCGNGKYLGQGDVGRFEVGADFSKNLLDIVTGRGHQAVRCDLLAVPFRDNSVSGLICIAALHHLATQDRRVCALQEMSRVLVPGARLLVYVWAKDQGTSHYVARGDQGSAPGESKVGEFGLPVHEPRTQFKHQDVLVPWKLRGEEKVVQRYYHVFEEGELEKLVDLAGNLVVEQSYYDQGNWCVVASKKVE